MTDPDLIDYLIGALDSAEQSAVEGCLSAAPELRLRLEHLRAALSPLEADCNLGPVPADLAERTLARLAAHPAWAGPMVPHAERAGYTNDPLGIGRTVVAPNPQPVSSGVLASPASVRPIAPREEPETRSIGGRLRADVIVACSIAFLAFGLLLTGVAKVRARSQVLACQANLQNFYAGLVGYADTHDGRYPQIAPGETAESFATTLVEAGQVPADFHPACPSVDPEVTTATYTYTLGFQSPSGVVGLRQPDGAEEHDLLPISADFPTASATPIPGPLCAHPPAMNVLFLGGNVRATTSPLIGPNGDDIYRNLNGQVSAGIDRLDVVLGRPGDRP